MHTFELSRKVLKVCITTFWDEFPSSTAPAQIPDSQGERKHTLHSHTNEKTSNKKMYAIGRTHKCLRP